MTFQNLFAMIHESTAVREYSCLMLDCDFLSEELKEIQNEICPCDVWDDEPGHGLEQEPHITCKYGILEQLPNKIFSVVDLFPVEFKLSGLSLFENEKYDVLKCSVISKDLHKINKQICENLVCNDTFPVYHPHLTVGYLKPGTGKDYIKIKSPIFNETLESNKFVLSDKMGNKVFKIV